MLKPPRPGSWGASTSMPPPESCSPLSGKSSSNTNTESFDGGKGLGCTTTFTVAGKAPLVAVHVTDPAAGTQGIGAPPMRPCGGIGNVYRHQRRLPGDRERGGATQSLPAVETLRVRVRGRLPTQR